MRQIILWISIVLSFLFVIPCTLLYLNQEGIIFHPEKLSKSHTFHFDQKFEEKTIKANDGTLLNGVLFKTDSAKGLVFYLHGNAGSLDSWGATAEFYTSFNYDVFMLDYRGYGKSEGIISSENQMFDDVQTAYNEMKKIYPENKIIVLGYSIGTGPAAKLASTNHPELLILQAPYYSLVDMAKNNFKLVPSFILKYKFETNEYLMDVNMPVVIFHGDQDEVIPYTSSQRLKSEFENKVTLITLHGQKHNRMTYNPEYLMEMSKILQP
jgi:uncharacterized protein